MKSGGQRRATILADGLEAVFGAIYLDQGLGAARRVAERLFHRLLAELPSAAELKDPKTRLQEWLQGRGQAPPTYRVLEVSGEPHDQQLPRALRGAGSRACRRGRRQQPPARGAGSRAANPGGSGAKIPGVSPENTHRWGTVVLAGRPNVGKSTLLNALAGRKLSIVTPKPQTTRHRVEGLVAGPGFRMILTDTPGAAAASRQPARALHEPRRRSGARRRGCRHPRRRRPALGRGRRRGARARRARSGLPIVLAVNKIDLHEAAHGAAAVPRARCRPARLRGHRPDLGDARREPRRPREGGDRPPAGGARGGGARGRSSAASVSRRPRRCASSSCSRSSDELPYGIAVEIERFEPTEDGRTEIDAIIWVEREGQRKIVIGTKGARLKAIGSAARLALNEQFGRRVHLNTWVKVRAGWSDDDRMLQRLGHEPS